MHTIITSIIIIILEGLGDWTCSCELTFKITIAGLIKMTCMTKNLRRHMYNKS